jgi:hypothetical protein
MARTHSGGGRTPVNKPVKTGAANRAVNPGFVSQLGGKVGEARAVVPMDGGKALSPPLGNELAATVSCGPGGSRTVSKSGSQATTGSGGSPRPDGGAFFPGFDGKK